MGNIRVTGQLSEPVTMTGIESRFASTVFMQYAEASRVRNAIKHGAVRESDLPDGITSESLKLTIQELEISLMIGILKSATVANEVHRIHNDLVNTSFRNQHPEDSVIISLIETTAVKASMLHKSAKLSGEEVKILSHTKRAEQRADFFIGKIPVICRILRGSEYNKQVGFSYAGDYRNIQDLKPILFSRDMIEFPRAPQPHIEIVNKCRTATKTAPLLLLSQYSVEKGIMLRDKNYPEYGIL